MKAAGLMYYGGEGYDGGEHPSSFHVCKETATTNEDAYHDFDTREAAIVYYESLEEPKSLWSGPDLLDAWVVEEADPVEFEG